MSITFEDFEIRYKNLRMEFPKLGNCSFKDCPNPIDITEGMGCDTSCAYHRLLFDYYIYEVVDNAIEFIDIPKPERRKIFEEWVNKQGKELCDKIVLEMAQDSINWVC